MPNLVTRLGWTPIFDIIEGGEGDMYNNEKKKKLHFDNE